MGKDTGHPHLLAPNLLTGGKGADLVIRGNVVLNSFILSRTSPQCAKIPEPPARLPQSKRGHSPRLPHFPNPKSRLAAAATLPVLLLSSTTSPLLLYPSRVTTKVIVLAVLCRMPGASTPRLHSRCPARARVLPVEKP
jgi:hypothetical protein